MELKWHIHLIAARSAPSGGEQGAVRRKYSLKVFNTLNGRLETFRSITEGRVKMFVCGPTVQGPMHVGHARTDVFYDVLARYLRQVGYKVTFLMNVTDIDESIVEGAREEGVSTETFVANNIRDYVENMRKLKVMTVTRLERVSGYVVEAIRQVTKLLESGHAYLADGNVYFDTSTYARFGRLSHQSREELTLRPTELSLNKRNLTDFILWRSSSFGQRWSSPWGEGVPGWHIQDTAVSIANFGPQYDIHGGAYELIYPHHEAEMAQAESLTGAVPFVRYWIHVGLVTSNGRKMSKSEGNAVTVGEILHEVSPSSLRFYLLDSRYHDDLEFNYEGLTAADERFRELKHRARSILQRPYQVQDGVLAEQIMEPFLNALEDDLNTARAIWTLTRTIDEAAETCGSKGSPLYAIAAKAMAGILGLDLFG
jgi:cysteinyl-tRNA synthetase